MSSTSASCCVRRGSRSKAFTLIELLVVISIIALLMAILVPVLQMVRSHGRTLGCRSNFRQWGLYYAMYTSDYEGRMPGVSHPECINPIVLAYASSHDVNDLLLCPMTKEPPNGIGASMFNYGSTLRAWAYYFGRSQFVSSYGQNIGGFWYSWEEYHDSGPFKREYSFDYYLDYVYMTSLVPEAWNVPVCLDAVWQGGWPDSHTPPPDYEGAIGTTMAQETIWPFVINRHSGGINALFMDWSVRKVGLKELWTLKWDGRFDTAGPWTRAGNVRPEDWPQWMRRFTDY